MMLQLNPPLPLDTPRGKALAHLIIDYGPEASITFGRNNDDASPDL
jgi:hypothetical protein